MIGLDISHGIPCLLLLLDGISSKDEDLTFGTLGHDELESEKVESQEENREGDDRTKVLPLAVHHEVVRCLQVSLACNIRLPGKRACDAANPFV